MTVHQDGRQNIPHLCTLANSFVTRLLFHICITFYQILTQVWKLVLSDEHSPRWSPKWPPPVHLLFWTLFHRITISYMQMHYFYQILTQGWKLFFLRWNHTNGRHLSICLNFGHYNYVIYRLILPNFFYQSFAQFTIFHGLGSTCWVLSPEFFLLVYLRTLLL